MSITAIEWAFAQPIEIPSAKLVLLALADHAGKNGHCWPSVERMCRRTGLSRATIFRAIETLTALGLVQQIPKPGRSNSYHLTLDLALPLPASDPSHHETDPSHCATDPSHHETPPSHHETLTVKNHKEPSLKRARSLPDGWQPDAELLLWAQERAPHVDTTLETEKFCNHWQATGQPRKDWRASWRNWILRSMRDYGPRPARFPTRMDGQRQRNHQRIDEALARRQPAQDEPGTGGGPQLKLIKGGAA